MSSDLNGTVYHVDRTDAPDCHCQEGCEGCPPHPRDGEKFLLCTRSFWLKRRVRVEMSLPNPETMEKWRIQLKEFEKELHIRWGTCDETAMKSTGLNKRIVDQVCENHQVLNGESPSDHRGQEPPCCRDGHARISRGEIRYALRGSQLKNPLPVTKLEILPMLGILPTTP